MQIDYDDEVEYKGAQCLYDLARAPQEKPFFLTVSYTHPHPPFVAPQKYWDLYRSEDIDAPRVPPIPFEELDEHSQWLYVAHAQDIYSVSDEQVLNARHAYYGMTTPLSCFVVITVKCWESEACGLNKASMNPQCAYP
jgi:choline-sulfatase